MRLIIAILGWAVVALGTVVASAFLALGSVILVIAWRQH
jgi:hypothetical protein